MHRAAQKGHLAVCWQLLLSPLCHIDDVDYLGNTALHVSAANGYENLARFFVENGADFYCTNKYRLNPLQVASTENCRSYLRVCMKKWPELCPQTLRNEMHQSQRDIYFKLKARMESIFLNSTAESCNDSYMSSIKRDINCAAEFGIPRKKISLARWRVKWIEIHVELKGRLDKVKESHPVITPTLFNNVNVLEHILRRVTSVDIFGWNEEEQPIPEENDQLINECRRICTVARCEYRLGQRLKQIQNARIVKKYAGKDDLDLLNELRECTTQCTVRKTDQGLIDDAMDLINRMTSEIDLQESFDKFPTVKLPDPEITAKKAREYWGEEDIGWIEETDNFPIPPESGYIWNKSLALQNLQMALSDANLKLENAIECNAEQGLIDSCQVLFAMKKEDEIKLLEKDGVDRELAFKEAEKKAKKLSKKRKKRKG